MNCLQTDSNLKLPYMQLADNATPLTYHPYMIKKCYALNKTQYHCMKNQVNGGCIGVGGEIVFRVTESKAKKGRKGKESHIFTE